MIDIQLQLQYNKVTSFVSTTITVFRKPYLRISQTFLYQIYQFSLEYHIVIFLKFNKP